MFVTPKVEEVSNLLALLSNPLHLSPDVHLDLIFETVDDILLAEKFEVLDLVLHDCKPESIGLDGSIALLSLTLMSKYKYKFRHDFFDKVVEYLNVQFNKEQVASLLTGLE